MAASPGLAVGEFPLSLGIGTVKGVPRVSVFVTSQGWLDLLQLVAVTVELTKSNSP